ncbi:MAG: 1,2-phenylacetyl-CoA epoxidase subunit PaaE [Owenweeksia sp.]
MLKFFKKALGTKKSLLGDTRSSSRPRFHTLRVQDITRETEDCVSVAFEIPEELEENYRFVPGQYLTLEVEIDGEKVRRSYSLCSSPLDGELRVAIKKVEGGRFSSWANTQLTVGKEMQVMTPEGKFNAEVNPEHKHNYVAFAAGSGITPVFSIMKSVLEMEPQSTFTLFYGNKTSNTVIFRDKIDGLKNEYMNRLEVHHVLSREDQGTDYLKGRIDENKCISFSKQFFDVSETDAYFLCGPEAMINCVSDSLVKLSVPKEKIHYELFTSPSQNIAHKTKVSATKKQDTVKSKVTVILDGEETHFDISSDGNAILDAALDAGADVPYACKGAVCCTCRAKVLEGSVEMEMNYALEDDEVEEGYVLTCQSHPTSEKVVVSYDE